MADPIRDELEAFHRQAEQSLMVPIVMLCLLHARDIDMRTAPFVPAAEALHDFCQHAADLNLWWSTADQLDAKRAAEKIITAFAQNHVPTVATGLRESRPDNVIGFVGREPEGEAS